MPRALLATRLSRRRRHCRPATMPPAPTRCRAPRFHRPCCIDTGRD